MAAKKNPFAIFHIAFTLSLVILIGFSTILYNATQDRINEHYQLYLSTSKHAAENLAIEIADALRYKQTFLNAFAVENRNLIDSALSNTNDVNLIRHLNDVFTHYQADHIASNIFRYQDGEPILLTQDYKNILTPSTYDELERFIKTNQTQTQVHIGKETNHFDLMVNFDYQGETYTLLSSYQTSTIVEQLKTSEIDQHHFILVNPNKDLLIEITDFGDLKQLGNRSQNLTPEERNRMLSSTPVKGTLWHVIDLHKENLFADYRADLETEMWLILAVLLSTLIAINVFVFAAVRKQRNYELSLLKHNENIQSLMRDSQASEARIQAVFDNVIDGIVTINAKGIIQTINPATTQLFGYSEQELIGQNIKILMPDPYQSEHDGYLEHYAQTGEKHIIGVGREVEGKRQDGHTFPLELSVTEIKLSDETLFVGILRDITDRKAAEKTKAEFISTVSHELRTPLTSIRGSIGLLKGLMAKQLDEKSQQLLNIAHNNTERLLMLINDILDMSKIESGKMDFHFNQLNVRSFLETALDANQGFASQHQVTLQLENHAENAFLHADEGRMMQVMNNLISNACKFAPNNSIVTINAIRRGHNIRISVTDHGSGIPKSLAPKIFDKFTQADSSDTRKVGGTGLGLNITKLMVEKHNGRISFVSEEGVGTTFYFDIPELIVNQAEIDIPDSGKSVQRILICEDEPDIASLLRLILAQSGFDSDIAHNAAEAEKLLEENEYSAMTLDIMLPDKDGTELFADIRENARTQNLPVVFVSSKAKQAYDEMSEALRDQSQAQWLNKPIEQDQLVSFVQRAISGKSDEVKHILHVEDDKDIQQMISMLLNDDYVVHCANNLLEARDILSQKHFDVVLLDIGLPDGSGLTLIDEIREQTPTPKVVIFSADDIKISQTNNQVSATLVKSKTTNDELVEKIKQLTD